LRTNERAPDYIDKFNAVVKRLNRTEKVSESIYEVFVLNTGGTVVASSDGRKIGLDRSTGACFLEGKSGPYIMDAHYSSKTGKSAIAVSAPIINKETNKLLGVVVAKISLEG
jgi:C4-dicarboxylate-specific signal transduction histidine kinase